MMKTQGPRECFCCETEKLPREFKVRQIVCKACQEDDSDYDSKCAECGLVASNKVFYSAQKCKECMKKSRRQNEKAASLVLSKVCVDCEEDKPKKLFRRSQVLCIECEQKPKEDIRQYLRICDDCEEEKINTDFRDNRKVCTDCERRAGRNYRRTTNTASEWVGKNKEKMAELQKKSYEKNKETIRENESNRLITDPHFRAIKAYRGSICNLINNKTHTNGFLVISRIDYVSWLEYNFDSTMSMDNHVEVWQIDHVLPLDILSTKTINGVDLDDGTDLSSIYRWFNTMPVDKKHNQRKNKYLDTEQLISHLTSLRKFFKSRHDAKEKAGKEYSNYKSLVQRILDK